MDNVTKSCQSYFAAQWAATGKEMPCHIHALTADATDIDSWFCGLHNSKYTNVGEKRRLRYAMYIARKMKQYHQKHGRYQEADVAAVKSRLYYVADSMSARYSNANVGSAGPEVSPQPPPNGPATAVAPPDHTLGISSTQSVRPEQQRQLPSPVGIRSQTPFEDPSVQDQTAIALSESRNDTPSTVGPFPTAGGVAEPTTSVRPSPSLPIQRHETGWDAVTEEEEEEEEEEEDDVVSLAATDEYVEEFEHLEASSGEEDYDRVRPKAKKSKLDAFKNLFFYGPE